MYVLLSLFKEYLFILKKMSCKRRISTQSLLSTQYSYYTNLRKRVFSQNVKHKMCWLLKKPTNSTFYSQKENSKVHTHVKDFHKDLLKSNKIYFLNFVEKHTEIFYTSVLSLIN